MSTLTNTLKRLTQSHVPASSPAWDVPEKTIPYVQRLPILGHTLDFLLRPVEHGVQMYQQYGPVLRGKSLGIDSVMLYGPDAMQFVFRNQNQVFSNANGWEPFIGPFFHRGIMLLDFDEHKFHRGILQAAFKRPAMVDYLARMNVAAVEGIQRWNPRGRMGVYKRIKQLTLDIATDVFMGEALGPEADKVNEAFIDCVLAGTAIVRHPVPGGRWARGLAGRKVLEDFFRPRVAIKRANPGEDLLSKLCMAEDENGQRFTAEDVVNHMIFLMMAAHDTSTITLSSMIYQLAKHPEWQDRVRAEAQRIGKEVVNHEDLDKLEVMDRVMRESLRLLSPVHVLPRKTTKDCTFQGYHIPADTMVIVSPIVVHHLPDVWKNPKKFDPDRFSPERQEHKEHPYKYVPFGGGAHMCIGLHFAEMEVKTILYHLVRRYRFSVPKHYEMPVNFTSLPTPRDGLPVRWEPIQ